jgi:hypothetical protein
MGKTPEVRAAVATQGEMGKPDSERPNRPEKTVTYDEVTPLATLGESYKVWDSHRD